MIPRIRQVYIQNYRSLAKAWATLEPFTILVGPNGTGKSNFVDALAFVKDCLTESPDIALRRRGGFWRTCSRFEPHSGRSIGIKLEFDLGDGLFANYAIEMSLGTEGPFYATISRERCLVYKSDGEKYIFEVKEGRLSTSVPGIRPAISPDRLALTVVSATEEFRPVYDFLTTMRFYAIVPDRLRGWKSKESGEFLARDGSNAAAVLQRLFESKEDHAHKPWNRIGNLLSKISSGTQLVTFIEAALPALPSTGLSRGEIEMLYTISFLQDVGDGQRQAMEAFHMSDGTLRALALLLAAYQLGKHSVIAIEEPEATIHPAAAEIILQVLQDASHERQILVTTHSPDIIDS